MDGLSGDFRKLSPELGGVVVLAQVTGNRELEVRILPEPCPGWANLFENYVQICVFGFLNFMAVTVQTETSNNALQYRHTRQMSP